MSHKVVDIFKKISEIPRCSKHCQKIASWIIEWAKKNGFGYEQDDYGNVIVNVPASEGMESKPSIALQGHMDMVCVKTKDSKHDFSKDPIEVIEENGWLRANGTTLGADDGVALAIGMALVEDSQARHPSLELVFTVDEEIGLVGAMHLKDNFIKSKRLINIDSEKEGVFIVGCAGGEDMDLSFLVERRNRKLSSAYKITVFGLKGGHSGVQINLNRANAIKLLNEVLQKAFSSIELLSMSGGKARNAIPDYAEAVVYTDTPDELVKICEDVRNYARALFSDGDSIEIKVEQAEASDYVLRDDDFRRVVDLIGELPHGVHEMYDDDTPKTSNNLAVVQLDGDVFRVSTNQRSLSEEGLDWVNSLIERIAKQYNCEIKKHSRYPSWTPKEDSKLLEDAKELYKTLFGVEPKVKVIHAGLECGIFASKLKDVDMISIGPEMEDIHTPNERLNVESFIRTYEFVKRLVQL